MLRTSWTFGERQQEQPSDLKFSDLLREGFCEEEPSDLVFDFVVESQLLGRC